MGHSDFDILLFWGMEKLNEVFKYAKFVTWRNLLIYVYVYHFMNLKIFILCPASTDSHVRRINFE